MALKGVRDEPVPTIKGAKPRLRAPKIPRPPETAKVAELGEEYLRRRNEILGVKLKRESMLLAHDRDQLIEKCLVERQLGWLLISMPQSLLLLAPKIGNRFGDREVAIREVVRYVELQIHETLTDLAKLPLSAEPGWLERLEEED